MAQSTELFKVLSDEDVSSLIEMLKKDMPNSYHVLCFVMNIMDFKAKVPEMETAVYAPNGDYSESTVFLFLQLKGMTMGTYYSETEAGCARLREALAVSQLFRDAEYFIVTSVHDRVYKAVGTDWSCLHLDHVTPVNLVAMSFEDILKLNPPCPDDVEVRRLRPEDADVIDSVWPHSVDGSVEVIRQVISISPSVGLYRRSDNKLLSWVLKWLYGGLGVLQTAEEAKRKGYAQIVIAELSKQLARDNWPVHGTILVNNFASMALFEKMGFTNEFLCHYLEFSQANSK